MAADPPVVPNWNVLTQLRVDWKPPVPEPYVPSLVHVKLVAFAMLKFMAAPVVVANTILPLPNAIERALVLLELKIPVVSVYPFSTRLPLVNVVVAVAPVVNASLNDVVPDTLLIVSARIVLPLLIILPVPTMFRVSDVKVPPDDSVRSPAMFNVVVGRAKAVDPKVRFLIKLVDVMVTIAIPAPVSDTLAALVASPAVAAMLIVLVTEASVVNPPGPVKVKLVAVAIDNTVAAAVVVDRVILPAVALPNAIERVLLLLELNIPVVRVTPSANVNVPAVNVYVPVTAKL